MHTKTFKSLMSFAVLWVAGAETWIPALERRASLLQLYDSRKDEVLHSSLVSDFNEELVHVSPKGITKYNAYTLSSSTDFVNTFEVDGAAQFNLLAGIVEARAEVKLDITKLGSFEKSSSTKLVKLDRLVRIESVNPCDRRITRDIGAWVYEQPNHNATHVVIGKTIGVRVEITVKSTGTLETNGAETGGKVNAGIDSFLGRFGASTSLTATHKNSSSSGQDELKINVHSNVFLNVTYPKSWQELNSFVDNVERYLNLNPSIGDTLNYIIEPLHRISHCHTGNIVSATLPDLSGDILHSFGRLLRELDRNQAEFNLVRDEMVLFGGCFTAAEEKSFQKTVIDVEEYYPSEKSKILKTINFFRNGSYSELQLKYEFDRMYGQILNENFSRPYQGGVEQKLSFLSSMKNLGIHCVKRHQNPLIPAPEHLTTPLIYLIYRNEDYNNLLSSATTFEFAKNCSVERLTCMLLNCDLGFACCKDHKNLTITSFDGLNSKSLPFTTFDPIKASILYLYRGLHVLEFLVESLDIKLVNSYNKIRGKLRSTFTKFKKLKKPMNYTMYTGAEYFDFDLPAGKLNPVERLVGEKILIDFGTLFDTEYFQNTSISE